MNEETIKIYKMTVEIENLKVRKNEFKMMKIEYQNTE